MADERREVGEDGVDLGEVSLLQILHREARLDKRETQQELGDVHIAVLGRSFRNRHGHDVYEACVAATDDFVPFISEPFD